MKRMLLCVLCLGAVAWGGEKRLCDENGKPLIQVAALKTVPLFEVKSIKCALFRFPTRPEYATAVKVAFIHRVPSPLDIDIKVSFMEMRIPVVKEGVLSEHIARVKPGVVTEVTLLGKCNALDAPEVIGKATLTPDVTFKYVRSPAE